MNSSNQGFNFMKFSQFFSAPKVSNFQCYRYKIRITWNHNQRMYKYQLYGIFLASEFRLFGIEESTFKETKIAVKIKAGKLTPPPKDLRDTLYKPASVANQELYYLNIMDIAQYQINGKNINQLKTDRIFSARHLLDMTYDIDGRLLDEKEVKNRMPEVIRFYGERTHKLLFCKIIDAYIYNSKGFPIIPEEATHKVIYLLRNPLDVVASYANHKSCSKDHAINMMNKKDAVLARQQDGFNINNQLPQLMYDWSGHVNSWHQQDNKVLTVRYEDMKHDGLATFSKVIADLELEVPEADIVKAIELTKFDKLKKAESEKGFKERNIHSPNFFRKGKTGGYKEELTAKQIEKIVNAHGKTMQQFGYSLPLSLN